MTTAMPKGSLPNFQQLDAELTACEKRIGRLISHGEETEVTCITGGSGIGESTRQVINANVQHIAMLVEELSGIASQG